MLSIKRLATCTTRGGSQEEMYITFASTMWIRQNPLWIWNPEETSPEIQNRGTSGPQIRTCECVQQKKTTTNIFYFWTVCTNICTDTSFWYQRRDILVQASNYSSEYCTVKYYKYMLNFHKSLSDTSTSGCSIGSFQFTKCEQSLTIW